ncbi:hypothetical protein Krac_1568 [Ktedonobacter racemifer DSM 44963]|uniref:Uncharacterized protein n=1 Tax=Ktedonobacter racemifer DSM 44963 TaxID=485913 RepID=D6U247_KTERA|nr:hypothetical protein Krac_1568 [Ktedonobacter racemifer DSM 44963]
MVLQVWRERKAGVVGLGEDLLRAGEGGNKFGSMEGLVEIRRGIGLRRVFLLGRDENEERVVAVGLRVIHAQLAIETLPLFKRK